MVMKGYVTATNTCTIIEQIKPCCFRENENRAQTPAAMDSCFSLVRPHQQGTAMKYMLFADRELDANRASGLKHSFSPSLFIYSEI